LGASSAGIDDCDGLPSVDVMSSDAHIPRADRRACQPVGPAV